MKTLLCLALPLLSFAFVAGCSSPTESTDNGEDALSTSPETRDALEETPRDFAIDDLARPRAIIELDVPNVVDCGLKLTFPTRPSEDRVALLGALLHTAVYIGTVHPMVHAYNPTTGELTLTSPNARAWSGHLVVESGDLRTPLAEQFRRVLLVPAGTPVGTGSVVRCAL